MSSAALKATAVVLVLLTLVLATLGFLVSRNYANRSLVAEQTAQQAVAAQAEANKALAVVALRALPAFKGINRDDIRLVPVAVVPEGYFASVEEVAGRIPLTDIDIGAPVTKRFFKEAGGLAKLIPAGHQALALEVNDVIAAGGFLQPGDVVDVLVYLRSGPGVPQPQARSLIEGIRVLAFEERLLDRPQNPVGTEDDAGGSRRRQRTAVLAVPQPEVTRVLLGAGLGELRLALRADGPANPRGDTADAISIAAGLGGPARIITAEELARGGNLSTTPPASTPAPPSAANTASTAAAPAQPSKPPRPTVEVIRGSTSEQVPQ